MKEGKEEIPISELTQDELLCMREVYHHIPKHNYSIKCLSSKGEMYFLPKEEINKYIKSNQVEDIIQVLDDQE